MLLIMEAAFDVKALPLFRGQLRPNRKQLGSEVTEALKGYPKGEGV